MATEWKKVKLGDIATFSNGINFGKESYKAGVKLIGVSNFGNRFFPDYDELEEVDENVLRPNDYLKNGDIVFVRSNGNKELVGRCMLIQNPPSTVTYSGFCIRARLNNIDENCPSFFAYYFKSKDFRKAMSNTAVGANIQNLNQGLLSNHIFYLPPLETQQKIAGILSAYDDLIENNRKQIKLLEEAAQKLYKEWFVKLNFPGHENVKIVDGVPEGWIETDINSICTKINAGGTPNRKKSEYWNNKDVKWFKTKELQDCWLYDSEEYISQKGLENSSAKIFPKNTILMAIYASPTLGRLGIITNEACCNQAALCMIANEEIISYQWLYLKLMELREYFNSVARGAGQQNISADVVKNKNILLPPKSLLDNFTKMIKPYFDKIKYLQNQIQLLQSARDKLLPKLMI